MLGGFISFYLEHCVVMEDSLLFFHVCADLNALAFNEMLTEIKRLTSHSLVTRKQTDWIHSERTHGLA
jgi:hypothetical protein